VYWESNLILWALHPTRLISEKISPGSRLHWYWQPFSKLSETWKISLLCLYKKNLITIEENTNLYLNLFKLKPRLSAFYGIRQKTGGRSIVQLSRDRAGTARGQCIEIPRSVCRARRLTWSSAVFTLSHSSQSKRVGYLPQLHCSPKHGDNYT